MNTGKAFGDKRRTPNAPLSRLLPFLAFLVVVAAPAMAQTPTVPSFINIGPGANQAYWTNPTQFQANWGASNFYGLTFGELVFVRVESKPHG